METWIEETTGEERIASIISTTSIDQHIDGEWLSNEARVEEDRAESAIDLLNHLDLMEGDGDEFAFDHRVMLFLTSLSMVDDRSYQEVYDIKEELESADSSNKAQYEIVEYYLSAAKFAVENYEMLTVPQKMQSIDDGQQEMLQSLLQNVSSDDSVVEQS